MITRKDFLNGMALTVGAAMLPKGFVHSAVPDGGDYPPALTGLRGSHPGSFEVAHALRDGQRWDAPGAAAETGETYDLIVVGAGISGLTAAYTYRKTLGPQAKILILDNHDDFGGHAKRNEFRLGKQTLISYGGTQSIEALQLYTPEALEVLKEIGIDLQRLGRAYDSHFNESRGLGNAAFFDKETFGRDQLVPNAPGYGDEADRPHLEAFLAAAPLAPQAKKDIVRLYFNKVDYLSGHRTEEKLALLDKMSVATFFTQYAKVHPDVLRYYNAIGHEFSGVGLDAIDARTALSYMFPRTILEGMQLTNKAEENTDSDSHVYHFPDGNASIARLLVRSLIPGCAPGTTMEDIVTAQMSYAKLDRASANVRIRLNSPVVSVRNVGDPAAATGVEAIYVRQGKAYKVRAQSCVLACWNMVIPYMCPELPKAQKEGLAYGVKVPLVYTNVLIRNWQALSKLRFSSAYCPGAYFSQVSMDFPVNMGGYHYTKSPEEPVVLHLARVPCKPGLSMREQYRAGHRELLATPFQTFEERIRDQLDRMFGAGGFDSKRDIAAITVNRWPHGYAYAYSTLWDPTWPEGRAPHEVGRKRFGRITIANSDAGGIAETSTAIEQGLRAVKELKSLQA